MRGLAHIAGSTLFAVVAASHQGLIADTLI